MVELFVFAAVFRWGLVLVALAAMVGISVSIEARFVGSLGRGMSTNLNKGLNQKRGVVTPASAIYFGLSIH